MYSQCLGHREIRNSPLALASSEFQTSLSYIKIFWLYFLTQVTNKSYMIAEGPNIPSPGYHHLSTGKNIWDAGYTDLTIHVLCGRTHTNISTQSQWSLKEKKKQTFLLQMRNHLKDAGPSTWICCLRARRNPSQPCCVRIYTFSVFLRSWIHPSIYFYQRSIQKKDRKQK